MKVIKAEYEILTPISHKAETELKFIEKIARTCYKSEHRITGSFTDTQRFIKMLIDNRHEAMIEHSTLSVKFICDRGFSHEIVRHRLCSFAQESTRYCNYSNNKFGNELTFIKPCFWVNNRKVDKSYDAYEDWVYYCDAVERYYFRMIENGAKPEEARAVLPNSLKTEIIVTANYREWRNILKLRTTKQAHPQMRELMIPLLCELQMRIPVIFDDIEVSV